MLARPGLDSPTLRLSCSLASQTARGVSARIFAASMLSRSAPWSRCRMSSNSSTRLEVLASSRSSIWRVHTCSSAFARRTSSRHLSACRAASTSFGSAPSACTACRRFSCGTCTRFSAALTRARLCSAVSCRCTVMASSSSPKTRAGHLEHVRMVLGTLRRHKLYAKASPRRPRLLPQLRAALLRRPADGPLQRPTRHVPLGRCGATKFRRAQGSADYCPGPPRVGPCAADAPPLTGSSQTPLSWQCLPSWSSQTRSGSRLGPGVLTRPCVPN